MCPGYTRDTSFLEMVVDIVQELKRDNPNLVYGGYTTTVKSDFSLTSSQRLRVKSSSAVIRSRDLGTRMF